ncbi:hypothetical protein [Sulfurivirga sp.]|uniref:hypothetical protein n=1 Tax=Sulfurivirga sp. TaxID=2614236 RepID=UPI0025ED75AA|nr:hypothetical protein [Sulfurivirga sp.]
MSRKERIQSEINWLKMWTTLMVTAFFAIAGWAFTHYDNASTMQLIVASLALLIVSVIVMGLNRAVHRYLDELEDLE